MHNPKHYQTIAGIEALEACVMTEERERESERKRERERERERVKGHVEPTSEVSAEFVCVTILLET